MSNFENEIENDINWRTSELSIIKHLELNSRSKYYNSILKKASIVFIYALWEGYVVSIFERYIVELNHLGLNHSDFQDSIITDDLDKIHNFHDPRIHFDAKVEMVKNISSYFTSNLILSSKVKTESNVNYKVINRILSIYHLDTLNKKYRYYSAIPSKQRISVRQKQAHERIK
jgi:hypothetical protein